MLVGSSRVEGALERIGLVEQFSGEVVDKYYRGSEEKVLTIV